MSENSAERKGDLLIVVTRLHAQLGEDRDEFRRDWQLPSNTEHSGVIEDGAVCRGFWVESQDGNDCLLTAHGYRGVLKNASGSFQDFLIGLLVQTPLMSRNFERSWVFAHGNLPELEDNEISKEHKPAVDKLTLLGPNPQMRSYSLVQLDASTVLPGELRAASVPESLQRYVVERLRIEPTVDRAVRGMQHILLEVRLWLDIARKGESQAIIATSLASCRERLNNAEHWGSQAIRTAVNDHIFAGGCKNLFEFLKGTPKFAEEMLALMKARGVEFPVCDAAARNRLEPFFQQGNLPFTPANPSNGAALDSDTQVNACLCALAARLEAVIAAAALVDRRRSMADLRGVA